MKGKHEIGGNYHIQGSKDTLIESLHKPLYEQHPRTELQLSLGDGEYIMFRIVERHNS